MGAIHDFLKTNEEKCEDRVKDIRNEIRRRNIEIIKINSQITSHFNSFNTVLTKNEKQFYLYRIHQCDLFLNQMRQDILRLEQLEIKFKCLRNTAAEWRANSKELNLYQNLYTEMSTFQKTSLFNDLVFEEIQTAQPGNVDILNISDELQIRLEALQRHQNNNDLIDEIKYVTM